MNTKPSLSTTARIATSAFFVLAFFFAFSSPQNVFAQSTGTINGTPKEGTINGTPSPTPTAANSVTIQNPLKVDSLTALLQLVLKAVVYLGTIALTLALIWVGFMFVMARGNAEKLSTARSALVWTIIGGLILLGAQAIGLVIQSTVNTL